MPALLRFDLPVTVARWRCRLLAVFFTGGGSPALWEGRSSSATSAPRRGISCSIRPGHVRPAYRAIMPELVLPITFVTRLVLLLAR